MARKYVNPAKSAASVDDRALDEARTRTESAAARLRAAERGDPLAPGWDTEYEVASASAKAAFRRLEALEAARAAQLERDGKRADAAKAAQKDIAAIEAALTASRDQVGALAAEHLRQLAALAAAAEGHNALLAQSRARLAELGLRVRDDLVDEHAEHDEGVLDGPGLRAGGVDWTPVPAAGVVAHSLREVFGAAGPLHPLAEVGKYAWRPHEVEARPDGLRVPTLADTGAVAPEAPPRVIARGTPIADVMPAREAASGDVSGYQPAPRRERRTAR